jgi:hypothetical protein
VVMVMIDPVDRTFVVVAGLAEREWEGV